MVCPHCRTAFHPNQDTLNLGRDVDGEWQLQQTTCPSCHRFVLELVQYKPSPAGPIVNRRPAWPKGPGRLPCPDEVPDALRSDYNEAAAVLSDSPKASAALTRRALQHLLREHAGVKPGNLQAEIEDAIKSGTVPPYIAEQLDAVRNIGNFAAHPMKSKQSGDVVPVEPGEAEWNLDVLDSLFEFFFVAPARAAERRAALNEKLKDAGKPEMP
jgi:hypothetical protein